MKIIGYTIARGLSSEQLEISVSEKLTFGWVPFGNPSGVAQGGFVYWIQAMVKYAE